MRPASSTQLFKPEPVRPAKLFGPQQLLDARDQPILMIRKIRMGDKFSWSRHMSPRQRLIWGAAMIGQMLFAVGWVYYVAPLFNRRGPWMKTDVAFFAMLLIPLLITFGLAWCFDRFVKQPGTATARLQRGLCGSCKYEIGCLPADSSGLVICPECGAAWKLNAPLSERVSA